MHAKTGSSVTIRFALPSARLKPFVTTYYCTQVVASPDEGQVEDRLHPEWANIRFLGQDPAHCAFNGGPFEPVPEFSVTGPTSCSPQFRMGSGRSWGIGLMPLGWAAFFAARASDYADRVVDGASEPAFAAFRPLAQSLAKSDGGFAEELALIEGHMEAIALRQTNDMRAIERVSSALVDPKLAMVSELADRTGMNIRSLERLSKRAFGFTPKLLLRRQRFLRSLAQFMLDPSLKWLSTLDEQYHDQAHFVRDFKRFMGMGPTEYAKLDKPILMAAAQARMAIAGEAVQVLHDPNRG